MKQKMKQEKKRDSEKIRLQMMLKNSDVQRNRSKSETLESSINYLEVLSSLDRIS